MMAKSVLLAATLFSAASANPRTYYLENNNLSQPGNLASVTLVDNGSNVDITVTAILPNLQVAGLGFNLNGNPATISCNSLPADYACNVGSFNYSSGGKFTDQADPSNLSVVNRYSSFSFTLPGYHEADFVTNSDGNLSATHVYLNHNTTGFSYGGQVVPVPAAAWLFGFGLLALAGIAKHRKPS